MVGFVKRHIMIVFGSRQVNHRSIFPPLLMLAMISHEEEEPTSGHYRTVLIHTSGAGGCWTTNDGVAPTFEAHVSEHVHERAT